MIVQTSAHAFQLARISQQSLGDHALQLKELFWQSDGAGGPGIGGERDAERGKLWYEPAAIIGETFIKGRI